MGLLDTMKSVRFLQFWQDHSPTSHELKEHLSSLVRIPSEAPFSPKHLHINSVLQQLRPILESMNLPPLLGISVAHNCRWPETVQEMNLFGDTATTIVKRCPSMQFVGFYRWTRHVSHEDMRWYRACAQSGEDLPVVEAVPPFEVPAVVSYPEILARSAV